MSIGQDVKDLYRTVAAMLCNRVELFGLEFAEERQRLVNAVIFGIAAAILGVFFLLGLSFLALMLLWDSPYRYAVVGGVTVLYAVLALVCLAKVKGLFAKSMPFACTIQVFKDDAAKVKGEMLTTTPFTDESSVTNAQNSTKEV